MEEKDDEIRAEEGDDVYHRIEELKRSNAALLAENQMFERFISRLDIQDLLLLAAGESLGAAGASQVDGGSYGWRRRSRFYTAERLQQLTLEQKLYVAQREITETRRDQEKLKQRYERMQDSYKASMREAELRLTEIVKAKNEFERRLLKPMKDNRLEIKDPEKILHYITDKMKIAQLEKFNLKNQMLMVQEKKLQQQLQQKKEMGKAEYEEIFQECDEQRINRSLEEVQVNTLKVQCILSSHKEKLQRVTRESSELSKDITSRKQMLEKIEEEIQHAEEERLKAEALNQHLRRQITDYQAPDITEYIHVKDKHKKLQKSIRTWERKVAIAEIALKSHSKAWNKQAASFTPANSAAAGARPAEHKMPVKLPHIQ
ncbi:hypothetical protein Q5P01_012193 [Channa striata]|uniref:Cilia- and flagella-associated protein 263 n=1 Tax=Channa striata TaxID=64152 RepID=A0AA88MSZ8_CHASR|nr:hypothetical protein Q5P01_012193 [Channa striata]